MVGKGGGNTSTTQMAITDNSQRQFLLSTFLKCRDFVFVFLIIDFVANWGDSP